MEKMRVDIINLKNTEKWKEYYTKNPYKLIKRKRLFTRDKENTIAEVHIYNNIRTSLTYTLNGELVHLELYDSDPSSQFSIKYDYSINKNIHNGDIVYCSATDHYYIMICDENNPCVENKLKFLGVYTYGPCSILGNISQYFIHKVSDEDIKKNNLEYLYEIKRLYDEKKMDELVEFANKIRIEDRRMRNQKLYVSLYNIKTRKYKKAIKVNSNDVKKIVDKICSKIKNKEDYIVTARNIGEDGEYYIYDSNGNLLLEESDKITAYTDDGFILEDTYCYDYSTKNLKLGDIVYNRFSNEYYILTKENDPTCPNVYKFDGLFEYPDYITIYGEPQYFIRKVSDTEINEKNLNYLYRLKELIDNDNYDELEEYRDQLILEKKGEV